jgi:hypothetical protein
MTEELFYGVIGLYLFTQASSFALDASLFPCAAAPLRPRVRLSLFSQATNFG